MKIAIFTDTFLPLQDGVVTATINLAKGLTDKGHKVYIICPKFPGLKKEFKHPGVKVTRISSIPAMFYEGYRFTSFFNPKLPKFLLKEKIDIIHIQTPITLGLQGIILAKLLGLPLVGTFHTFFADEQYLKHIKMDYKHIQKLAWLYSQSYYNRCDLITCPSESTKIELLENGFTKQIKVISNGINPKIFNNTNSKKMKEKYNPNGKTLLFIGRIAHEKNISYLLDCFKLIVNKVPKTKLLLVGSGPQMEEIKEKIKNLNLEKNVIIAGRIEHADLVKSGIFKACDLFVSASTTENQPMTVLEAQINGLPCVLINEKGMKDLVKDGYNGFLIKNKDKKNFALKTILLLNNKKLNNKMKLNTEREIKKHYLDNVIKEWEKEYKILINKNKYPGAN